LSDLNSGAGRQPIVGVGHGPIVRRSALIQVKADPSQHQPKSTPTQVNTDPSQRRSSCRYYDVSKTGTKPAAPPQSPRSQTRLRRRFGWIFAVKNATGVDADIPTLVDKVGWTINMAGKEQRTIGAMTCSR
jgi:hypothetical protein